MALIIMMIIGLMLDLLIGDPNYRFHLVRMIGLLITVLEKLFRKICFNKYLEFICGTVLTITVITVTYVATMLIFKMLYSYNIYLYILVGAFVCYQTLAIKGLTDASMKVYYQLRNSNIVNARRELSKIVGRDTQKLNQEQIICATIETVAENLTDAIIAPMIYFAFGGVALALTYKAINTLDSMIAYRNQKYFYFGKTAAIIDDVVNYIPAIIAAYLIIVASYFLKLNYKNSYSVYARDKYNHLSPNSAKTEAACAGALGVQLGGANYYQGILVNKPRIGNKIHAPKLDFIIKTNNLIKFSALLAFTLLLLIKYIWVIT